ncbi:MAG: hypothetical protein H7A32_02590 [Deltaproteobacteria bacterium]|nr:hypothetical protein [Deltaproteobacteria bacterium]
MSINVVSELSTNQPDAKPSSFTKDFFTSLNEDVEKLVVYGAQFQNVHAEFGAGWWHVMTNSARKKTTKNP